MARARTWKCQRQTRNQKCGTDNPARLRNCAACGKPRPKRKRPEHMRALDLPYEAYIELNGGDHCAICGRSRPANRRLDRDHDHKTGEPRGLLCHRCNRTLASWITPGWLLHAATYLIIRGDSENDVGTDADD